MVTKYLLACLMDTDAKLLDAEEIALLRRHKRTGRPLGEAAFLDRIEKKLGRHVRSAKAGCKPKRREK